MLILHPWVNVYRHELISAPALVILVNIRDGGGWEELILIFK